MHSAHPTAPYMDIASYGASIITTLGPYALMGFKSNSEKVGGGNLLRGSTNPAFATAASDVNQANGSLHNVPEWRLRIPTAMDIAFGNNRTQSS